MKGGSCRYQIPVQRRIQLADGPPHAHYGAGMLQPAPPGGMMELYACRETQYLLPEGIQKILHQLFQVLIRKFVAEVPQIIKIFLGVSRGAGNQTAHIHIVLRGGQADALHLQLLHVLPDIYGGPDLYHILRVKGTICGNIVIPQLGGAFSSRIRHCHIHIGSALAVRAHGAAFDHAETLYLGPAALFHQIHAAHLHAPFSGCFAE